MAPERPSGCNVPGKTQFILPARRQSTATRAEPSMAQWNRRDVRPGKFCALDELNRTELSRSGRGFAFVNQVRLAIEFACLGSLELPRLLQMQRLKAHLNA